MNNIKNRFSIKDLENLTGIKAHTIRIWEKRYNLLEPKRTDTNIRYYDLENFQKLLNISFLNNNGYKISKISKISEPEILELVKTIAINEDSNNHAINSFKLAMLNFDQKLFFKTYDSLLTEKPFSYIFHEVFVPMLNSIGILWQTDTITPAHEHFICSLIRQKIISNTEKAHQKSVNESKKTFVLYLPDNEIHELGLLYINYEIINNGFHSIFLGPSVPVENLKHLQDFYNDITYISYFTIKPEKENVIQYIETFTNEILKSSNSKFWILGHMLTQVNLENLPESIKTFNSIKTLTETLLIND
ncbi:MerR family transcriptional regulator [Winogradskyella endarachnes]|uniref:MerR family transcriptional regulator n=1 Tax=Winogradskyella endarachnes TaxID=2681965 RepID=A0A6L6UBN4_9FLAO|nr:MerR family transcriptional regulator [Winogradskyella endarachnes]MUU79765.1 MerR family transcriptional regulator [Winogradskyella endarachnes]